METVKVEGGIISGMVQGKPGNEVRVYLGVPYAASTAGENRWRPPQPVTPWKGVKACHAYAPAAPQEPAGAPFPEQERGEDCLTLNVLTPARKAGEKLPVMVWFHGGGYTMGSANNRLYSSIPLPQHGVVLVTTNHRLGLMGMMAHPLLSKESKNGVSGNYLFLDMIASLKWVKKNIKAFGGDSNNVSIFGESGGGGKVASLMASPLAKGLFHRGICESGTAVGAPLFGGMPLKELEAKGEAFFKKLGVDKAADPLQAARAIPWQKLLEAELAFAKDLGMQGMVLSLWDAAIDGWYLQDNPTNVFKSGKHNHVPLIVGANKAELTEGGMLLMPWIIPAYVTQLNYNTQAGSKGYAYIFDRVPEGWKKLGMQAGHGLELHYVFGMSDAEDWRRAMPGEKMADPELNEVDARVADNIMSLWAQFAKTGNPSIKGLIEWPAYDSKDEYIYLSDPLAVKKGFSKLVTEEDLKKATRLGF